VSLGLVRHHSLPGKQPAERLMSYASRFGEASRRAEAFRLIVITDQNNQNNSLDKSETVRDNSLQWIWVFYQDL
jgi:hypothetical protein